jgi:DNA repair protein RecN (Recombination protein N)
MLAELQVSDLGVIADLTLVLGPGMTALTGETGAGKTLVVEAIELLVGGKADSLQVRRGAANATVEGRFFSTVDASVEFVLVRTVPVEGRSRGYINTRMAPLSALEDAGEQLVDLYGQHAHQSLLLPSAQRAGLDRFGSLDVGPVTAARRRMREGEEALASLGGDARARARELDLLRFQVGELEAAGLVDAGEEVELAAEEERLAGATSHREAAAGALQALTGEGGVVDTLGGALSMMGGRAPLARSYDRLRALGSELQDAVSELRVLAESLEDDPQRLDAVRERRQLLRSLRRKYGDDLAEVLAYRDQAKRRLDELASYEARAAVLEEERAAAQSELVRAEAVLGRARREAAPGLATAVEAQLHRLAMPRARFEVVVGDDPAGEDVTWLLGANPGEPALPLSKVASGGELARTMLALRLVLGSQSDRADQGARRTLVFDEVDSAIGGEAAVTVGRALADVARHDQVLVVTHLAQVAAFADEQIAVTKEEIKGRTRAQAHLLEPAERVIELSRMLSGRPDSPTAHRHAEELLAAAQDRGDHGDHGDHDDQGDRDQHQPGGRRPAQRRR